MLTLDHRSLLPVFPPKRYFRNKAAAFIATRSRALQTYFDELTASPLLASLGFLRWALQPPPSLRSLLAHIKVASDPTVKAFDGLLASVDARIRSLDAGLARGGLAWCEVVWAGYGEPLAKAGIDELLAAARAIPYPIRSSGAETQVLARARIIELLHDGLDEDSDAAGDEHPHLAAMLDADLPRTLRGARWLHTPQARALHRGLIERYVKTRPDDGYSQALAMPVAAIMFVALDGRVLGPHSLDSSEATCCVANALAPAVVAELDLVVGHVLDRLAAFRQASMVVTERVTARVVASGPGAAVASALEAAGLDLVVLLPRWLKLMWLDELPGLATLALLDAVITADTDDDACELVEAACVALILFLHHQQVFEDPALIFRLCKSVSPWAGDPAAANPTWLVDGAAAVSLAAPATNR
ncbi:uncharacterized protein AMSG_09603 [Thecamonas trahens ATCC 50062]|uniref:PX domain-containing protein n=1 Tax=Thecamonas trahens ATCC 50062 TaxID=461836 RepID=A0A0L0DNR2_THETB|nr:hypothetical protein AMSG_09603 [Thecamonas trahens ATCC 50062]KNC53957.1 hypothetical protein AMSG_09603 [Thecamonas trahens ATCC 50062]|eukprot:XP_013754159.1 hypothetical protein AMSG_09603 [Thecamonas trahens ATCC 50062]